MATYKLEIDGSGAESGSQRIVKSFDAIKAAAEKMEGGVTAAAKKASAAFAQMASAKPVSQSAINSLRELSAVFKNFKGPSEAATRNTIAFLQGIAAVGRLKIGGTASLSNLLTAIAGFKGPTPLAGKNTESLLKALQRASGISVSRGLGSTLNALSTFKGPSAYAAKNITAMLNSLAAFKAPTGLRAATNALNALTAAANAANGSMQRLRVTTNSKMSVNIRTGEAHKNISSLIRQQNLMQMALLRTQTLWNSLGGILAGRAIVNASNDIIKIRAQLEAATGTAAQARIQFQFLQEQSQRLGLDFRETAKSYGFFLGAIKGTGMTFKETQDIFRGFSTAARALQLSTSDVDGIFRALGQIMSKGKLQAEELRQQLGDRLPGAFVRFAKALDMTKPGELDAALKKGAISGDKLKKALIEVAAVMEVEFADSAEKMSKTVDAAFNRLKNSFVNAAAGLGSSGMNEALIALADTMRAFLESEGLSDALWVLGKTMKVVAENINLVVYAMGTLALSATLKWVAALGLLQKAFLGLVTTVKLTAYAMAGLRGTALMMAAGMGSVTAATTVTTRAWMALNAVMKANIFLIIAAVIVAVVAAYMNWNRELHKNEDALRASGRASAVAENAVEQFTLEIMENTNQLDRGNQSLRERIRLQVATAQGTWREAVQGITGGVDKPSTSLFGRLGGTRIAAKPGEHGATGYMMFMGERITNPELMKAVAEAARATSPKEYQRAAGRLGMLAGVQGELGALSGPERAIAQKGYEMVGGRLEQFNPSTYKMMGLSYESEQHRKEAEEIFAGPAAEGGGITGEPIEKAAKTGGKTPAEEWADKLKTSIRSAQEALSDLTLETEGAAKASENLLAGMDPFAAAAEQAANTQLKAFKDTFKTTEEEAKGIVALAEDMQKNNQIAAGVDISTAAAAEQAILDVYSARQKQNAEAQKHLEISQTLAGMQQENKIQEQANALLAAGGTQEDYNKLLYVEQQLLGASQAYRDANIDKIEQEYDAKVKLARQTELLNAQRELEVAKTVNTQMAGVYAQGGTPEQVANLKEIVELRAKMASDGATEKEIADRVKVVQGMQEQIRVMKKMEDAYEKLVQLATDMADAIVNGFKEGIESGQGFLKTLKGIFKDLKNIIMDAYVYNPLKQFLRDSLLGVMGGIAPGAAGGTTTSSTGGGSIGSAGGGFNLGSLFNFMSGSDTGSTSTASAQTKVAASEIGKEVGEVMMDINGNLVQGGPGTSYQAIQTLQTITSPSGGFTKAISGLKKLFDPKSAKAAGDAMKKSFQTGKGIGGSISGVVGVAAEAYGMWKMGNAVGKGVAKALGGGFRTQAVVGGVVGGAAAGYKLGSMFGPMGGAIGAGVGAVVGGILGFLKKKPKIPSSYGSIVVGEDGIAVVGEAGKYGKGSKKIGKQMADAAAKMFNDFAENLDATLTAGSYGSFGQRVFSKKKGATAESFYSLLGTSSKGKPLGREGVDWIKGTDTEVQAFALIQQVRKGMITGLSNVMQQVFANTKATTMEQLQEDIGVGKAYEEFIKGSFHMADLAKQAKDLNDAWKKLSRQAAELGLNTEALAAARDRMMAQMKKDFNYQISQGILGYENPALAAFNDLEREYRETVENAMAVGGDLVAVEKYYGLRRTELVKQMAEEANNGIKKIAKDLLTSLTASSASPLSAQSIFGNAQQMFRGLVSQISSGDYTNVDQLNTYATNYLDAARSIGASSVEYFDIFQEVTDFLKEVSSATGGAGGGTGLTDLPALPDIDTIVAEINARNAEMVAATEQVGEAVVESGTQVVDTLNYGFGGILGALLGQITGTNGYPAGYIPPTGTGVASTGGTGGSYGTSATTGGGGSYGGGSGGGGGIYGSDVNLV